MMEEFQIYRLDPFNPCEMLPQSPRDLLMEYATIYLEDIVAWVTLLDECGRDYDLENSCGDELRAKVGEDIFCMIGKMRFFKVMMIILSSDTADAARALVSRIKNMWLKIMKEKT